MFVTGPDKRRVRATRSEAVDWSHWNARPGSILCTVSTYYLLGVPSPKLPDTVRHCPSFLLESSLTLRFAPHKLQGISEKDHSLIVDLQFTESSTLGSSIPLDAIQRERGEWLPSRMPSLLYHMDPRLLHTRLVCFWFMLQNGDHGPETNHGTEYVRADHSTGTSGSSVCTGWHV